MWRKSSIYQNAIDLSSKHHHDFVVGIKVIIKPEKPQLSLRGIESIFLLVVSLVNR